MNIPALPSELLNQLGETMSSYKTVNTHQSLCFQLLSTRLFLIHFYHIVVFHLQLQKKIVGEGDTKLTMLGKPVSLQIKANLFKGLSKLLSNSETTSA